MNHQNAASSVSVFIYGFPAKMDNMLRNTLYDQIYSRFENLRDIQRGFEVSNTGKQYYKLEFYSSRELNKNLEDRGMKIDYLKGGDPVQLRITLEYEEMMRVLDGEREHENRMYNNYGNYRGDRGRGRGRAFRRGNQNLQKHVNGGDNVRETINVETQNIINQSEIDNTVVILTKFSLPDGNYEPLYRYNWDESRTEMNENFRTIQINISKHKEGYTGFMSISFINLGCWVTNNNSQEDETESFLPYWPDDRSRNSLHPTEFVSCNYDSNNRFQMMTFELNMHENGTTIRKRISLERASIDSERTYFRDSLDRDKVFEAWITLTYPPTFSVFTSNPNQHRGKYNRPDGYWDKVQFAKSKYTPSKAYFTQRVNGNELEDYALIRPVIYIQTTTERWKSEYIHQLKEFIIECCNGVENENVKNKGMREIPVDLSFRGMKEMGLGFNVIFNTMALICKGTFSVFELDMGFLSWVSTEFQDLGGIIEGCLELMQDRGINPKESIRACFYRHYLQLERGGIEDNTTLQDCMQRRINWTPFAKIYSFPELEITNRVMRQWIYMHNRFLRVKFCDENGNEMNQFDKLSKNIEAELIEGMQIANSKFQFLGCSQSMLRSKACWLFSEPTNIRGRSALSIENIWGWMGDFEGEKNVSKRLSRMGQCFSTTYSGPLLKEADIKQIADVEATTPDGTTYCFSDGVGTMSSSIMVTAVSVLNDFKKYKYAAALQVRIGGVKGVLSYDPSLQGNLINIRPSQNKFPSVSTSLEIISGSKMHYGHLNHQVILLLSTQKIQDDAFSQLLQIHLEKLKNLIIRGPEGQKKLEKSGSGSGSEGEVESDNLETDAIMNSALQNMPDLHSIVEEMLRSGMSMQDDPFLSMINEAVYCNSLNLVKSKLRILDEKSVSLIGIMDELNILEYGQVFCRISRTNNYMDINNITVQGGVIVTKCPCLFPGDIRVLTAVEDKRLNHYINVIVFPQKGPRPHPNEISGSDLDGDNYYLSWNSLLIPAPENRSAPAQFPGESAAKKDKVTAEDLIGFYCNYNSRNKLGQIANTHKALCDDSPSLANDPKAILLAEEHSKEVDFPKTGKGGEVPKDCRIKRYPDYMEKEESLEGKYEIYTSNTILGKLYRKVDIEKADDLLIDFRANRRHIIDTELVLQGYQTYVQEATRVYKNYSHDMIKIMRILGINTESDLITGNVVGGRDYEALLAKIHINLQRIKTKYIRKFKEGRQLTESEKDKKASAYYLVAYDIYEVYTGKGLKEKRLLRSIEQYSANIIYELILKEVWRELDTKLNQGNEEKEGKETATKYKKMATKQSTSFYSFPWIVCGQLLCKIKKKKSYIFNN